MKLMILNKCISLIAVFVSKFLHSSMHMQCIYTMGIWTLDIWSAFCDALGQYPQRHLLGGCGALPLTACWELVPLPRSNFDNRVMIDTPL